MNTNIQSLVCDFAKANKVSKAKLEAFTATIIASIPHKASGGHRGRPMLEKTAALRQRIIEQCQGREIDSVSIRQAVGSDPVTFNNALATLVKAGKIIRIGKAQTGRKGRQPYILTTVKPE